MRPLPSTSSRNQHHDDSDTLSQQTPVASLDCFITTEAGIIGDYSGQRPMETRPTLQNHTQKQGVSPTMPAPCGHIPSSVGSSNAEHEKSSRPLTPVLSDNAGLFGPDSANSTPSSPGGLSSVAMSEDPHSLSASFSDLPLSHSPLPDISSSSPRAITPQLVMPSLTVPQRRPFSETGRSLGKLKILVTGRQGMYSFIRSINRSQCRTYTEGRYRKDISHPRNRPIIYSHSPYGRHGYGFYHSSQGCVREHPPSAMVEDRPRSRHGSKEAVSNLRRSFG